MVSPRSLNKLNYFRGVVLKEITNLVNQYQGDYVFHPDEVLEGIIKPRFYFEWEYLPETDEYIKKNLSLKDISDQRMGEFISDVVNWAEYEFNVEISKP